MRRILLWKHWRLLSLLNQPGFRNQQRVDAIEQLCRAPCLVALQVADHVPARRRSTQRFDVRIGLLHPVLAQLADTERQRLAYHRDRHGLHHRHQRHIRSAAPRACGGPIDRLADRLDAAPKARGVVHGTREGSHRPPALQAEKKRAIPGRKRRSRGARAGSQ